MILTVAERNTLLNYLSTQLSGGYLKVRKVNGDILGTLQLKSPAFSAASNGAAAGQSPTPANCSASGTASYATLETSANVELCRGLIGLTGSGSDVTMASLVLETGDLLEIPSFTVTLPSGE